MSLDVEKIVREYIDKSIHMSLGTASKDGRPWVCEVHFTYDDKLNIYWRSLTSRRHSQEIEENPFVAGNIVAQHELGDYPHAIYFEGRAMRVDDETQYGALSELFRKRQIGGDNLVDDAKKDDGHKFYKIEVSNWYAFGKFGGEKGQKYELEWNGGEG
jgi:uncharacterized protein YhbP (UPF0306 family)